MCDDSPSWAVTKPVRAGRRTTRALICILVLFFPFVFFRFLSGTIILMKITPGVQANVVVSKDETSLFVSFSCLKTEGENQNQPEKARVGRKLKKERSSPSATRPRHACPFNKGRERGEGLQAAAASNASPGGPANEPPRKQHEGETKHRVAS